jgi:hypothetical protein
MQLVPLYTKDVLRRLTRETFSENTMMVTIEVGGLYNLNPV